MFNDDKHNPLGRFDGLAAIYSKHRPSYPEVALDWIIEKLPDRSLPIADIGAGTGILSRQLAQRGCRVIGIEPNESMRQQAEAAHSPAIEYRDGTAESTGLPDASASGVVVAQAFHWCEPNASLREFHRILGPGGWVNLLWNSYDLDDPLAASVWRELRATSPEPNIVEKPHHEAGRVLLTHPLFERAVERIAANEQVLDEEGLLGRLFSVSYAPKECSAAERFAGRLRELFQHHQRDGVVRLRYRTTIFQAERKGTV